MNNIGLTNDDIRTIAENLIAVFDANPQRVDSLPPDVDRVVIRDTMVIVYLRDGSRGKANCDYMDTFDPYVGFVMAYYKAKNGKNFELKNVLKSCIENAKRKDYKQAVLKNYDNKKKQLAKAKKQLDDLKNK